MVSEKDVKLCALCGTLNHERNPECFTCGWRGQFEHDSETIHLAWQRLYDEFESVEVEHITGSRTFALNELGVMAKKPVSKRISVRIREWWQRLFARPEVPASPRVPINQRAFPPNELGV